MVTQNQYYVTFRELSLVSISCYECEIMTQIHHFGCRGLSVEMIYGQGKIAESQGKVREFLFPGVIGSDVPWLECPACNALTWVITVTE